MANLLGSRAVEYYKCAWEELTDTLVIPASKVLVCAASNWACTPNTYN